MRPFPTRELFKDSEESIIHFKVVFSTSTRFKFTLLYVFPWLYAQVPAVYNYYFTTLEIRMYTYMHYTILKTRVIVT